MAAAPVIARPPANFSAERLMKGVYWHQGWEVFQGVETPGRNPVMELCRIIGLPQDLTGKRVLDIGAWNGCFSFECERRGAAEVLAYSLEDPEQTGFNRLRAALNSRVGYRRGSVYSLVPRELGSFDIVLFLGVLYHLRYPLLGLDRVRGVARDVVYVESHVIDNAAYLRGPKGLGPADAALGQTPVWRQYLGGELAPGDDSNWFSPNMRAAIEALESAGFVVEESKTWAERGCFRCRVAPVPARLQLHCYEAFDSNQDIVGIKNYGAARSS
jgi:tRNA (mo5U34)-methyltransferase